MTGVTGDFEGLENFNLEDLHELRHEQKKEVKKQIEAIYIEATSLEKKARELACDTNSKQYILRHAQTLTEKANEMKEKICLASGKSFQTPDELQIAIKQSIASNEEQTLIVERLKRNCSSHGLEYRGQTPGNGNCFFEAITCQLDRIGADVIAPEQLRTNVVNYISTHPSFEGSQGIVLLENFVEDNFPDYCDRMLQNGEYADHVVVIGMSRMLQRDIVIVTSAPSTNNEDSVLWVTGCDGFSGNPILLGHIFENHYQSLQPKGDSGKLDHHTNDKHATNDDNLFIPVDVCNEELSNYNMTHDVEDMPFVEFVRSTFIKKRKNGTDCIVRRLRNEVDNEDVITKHLMDITITGNFIHRKANKTTLQYRCER
ncbi:uncharacterized protein LOC127732440 [Mytilus californianus]|uniref:uncharacterized protein LOC127732440 n=1 Tax=Mytilus californianus TaxID=6549 RepID=UPI002245CBFB|nr:uncharacterized protein LOC127732440 [Mytilus californianus]